MTIAMRKVLRTITATAILLPLTLAPTPTPTTAQSDTIEAITIHPPVAARFQCSEHPLGAEDHVPDALGADCVVGRQNGGPNGNLASLYTGDGTRNEDWHSWREPLLAPFDAVVTRHPDQSRIHAPRRPRLGTLERHPVPATGRRRTHGCPCRIRPCPRGYRIPG